MDKFFQLFLPIGENIFQLPYLQDFLKAYIFSGLVQIYFLNFSGQLFYLIRESQVSINRGNPSENRLRMYQKAMASRIGK